MSRHAGNRLLRLRVCMSLRGGFVICAIKNVPPLLTVAVIYCRRCHHIINIDSRMDKWTSGQEENGHCKVFFAKGGTVLHP